MNLIERYIYAVTRHLPVDQREDVADELKSMIEDQLDEIGSRSKKDVEKVLISLGDPENLARRYKGGKQYLIGPAFYPIFIRTLKISFAIGLPIAFIIQLVSQLSGEFINLSSLLVSTIGATIAIGIQIIFWVGLVFFILERSEVSPKDMRRYEGVWNPSMLPKISAKRQIPISDAITDIFTYLFLIFLAALAQFIGVHTDNGIIPFFNPQIWAIIAPSLIVLGIVGVIKGILKLILRDWSKPLAVFNLLFALVVSTGLILAFLKIDIINPAFLSILAANVDTTNLEQVTRWTFWTLGITIAITVGIYLYDALKNISLTFRRTK